MGWISLDGKNTEALGILEGAGKERPKLAEIRNQHGNRSYVDAVRNKS